MRRSGSASKGSGTRGRDRDDRGKDRGLAQRENRGQSPGRQNRGLTAKQNRGLTPNPWLQTLRLDFREFAPGDVEDIVRLDGDPRVMKYIGDGRVHTRDEVVRFWFPRMRRLPRLYADLGVWHASRRDTGAFVGWFSLKYAGKSSDIEIGYRLVPEAWGRGFATEGAAAMRDYGFDDVGLARIIGITHPGNRASQRVLARIGMVDEGWGDYYEQRLRLFAIYAAE